MAGRARKAHDVMFALGLSRQYPSSRHAYIDKTAIVMPNRVDARAESRNCCVEPISEQINGSTR